MNKRMPRLVSTEAMAHEVDVMRELYFQNSAREIPLRAVVQTFGCQLNENDSEKICGMLEQMGYVLCEQVRDADLILFNTCAIRENAHDKVFGLIGSLKHLKEERPSLLIGLCGCMAQEPHVIEKIRAKYRHVDFVFGTHTLYRFPSILKEAYKQSRIVLDLLDIDGEIAEDLPVRRVDKVKASVSIMFGCNNFCSYCIVPHVRGRERSRASDAIIKEVQALVREGYREITLLGQNVNSYGLDLEGELDFPTLLERINEIEGAFRVRFMTSHPKDISKRLIDVIAKSNKICNQLHIPVQSGSDIILKAMNRHYTRSSYMEIINYAKERIPDLVLTSDIIVGFPGETEADFEETLKLVREVEYDTLFTFLFSPRRGTPAEKMPDLTPQADKQARFERLLATQNEISRRKNEGYLGSTVEVLVEGVSKNDASRLTGRTEGGKIVNFEAPEALIGTFCKVRISDVQTWSLTGELIKGE